MIAAMMVAAALLPGAAPNKQTISVGDNFFVCTLHEEMAMTIRVR